MYTSIHDEAASLLVGIWSGDTNTDADFDTVVGDLERSLRTAQARPETRIHLMFADADNPPPGAAHRQRLIRVVKADPGYTNTCFVMVTPSLLIRGAVTAVAWFAPEKHKASAHANLNDALEWIDGQRPGVRPRLQEMATLARREAERRQAQTTSVARR